MNDAQKTSPAPPESAMGTGTDNEPDLTIGDKHAGDAPDPNGDGILTVDEAETLLGGEPSVSETKNYPTSLEGK